MFGVTARPDLALDLGTSQTRVATLDGVVLRVPSVIALHHSASGPETAAYGEDAREMLGRAPSHMTVHQPIQGGKVQDFGAAEHFVRALFRKLGAQGIRGPSVLVASPDQLSEAEHRALLDCIRAAGASKIQLIPGAVAAAVGADLPIVEPVASLLVDNGGGHSEVALFSLGGIVARRSIQAGGVTMDQAIIHWFRRQHDLLLSASLAEQLKLSLSTDQLPTRARGRDLRTGKPRELEVTPSELREILAQPITTIVDHVVGLLRSAPPELSADLLERGLILAGDTSNLPALQKALRTRTTLATLVVSEPGDCVARGLGRLTADRALLASVLEAC